MTTVKSIQPGVQLSGVHLYRLMLTIQRLDEVVYELRQAELVAGSVHLCCGQEAIPAGGCAVLRPQDRVVARYRGTVMRPIAEVMWADFLLVALDQLVNQAANIRYIHRGERSAAMVVRCQQGAAPGSCAQHSQSLEELLAHIPGLKVGLPSTPQDAYTMLRAVVADEDPCIVIESRLLYQLRGWVDLEAPPEAAAGASRVRDGNDAALITWGRIRHDVVRAADALAAEGINASVTDLRWLSPLDDVAIAQAVNEAGRVLVVHEANTACGFGAEVVARISSDLFDMLDAPPRRRGLPDVRMPASPVLQAAPIPSVDATVVAARELVRV